MKTYFARCTRSIRNFQLHCFSPPEIHNIHLISGLDYETIMARLKDAGLYSLPGGGGEILDDEVRKRVSTKCTTDEWLAVMRAVHRVGLRSTATMMFGIGDNVTHRVRHLQRVRDLQDETGGFTAFIPWTFQRENTALGRKIKEELTGVDYLKMLSVSRLFLDNIENIQSSWLTQGLKLGQVALRFGANDMGSIMIEENVVSAAGAHNRADEQMLRYLIREAGFIPQQRDILYVPVHRDQPATDGVSQSTPLRELTVMIADSNLLDNSCSTTGCVVVISDSASPEISDVLSKISHQRGGIPSAAFLLSSDLKSLSVSVTRE